MSPHAPPRHGENLLIQPAVGFDFDARQLPPQLEHEIHFVAVCRAPVRHLGARHVDVAPRKQVAKNPILEVCALWGTLVREAQ